nr:ParA family protein [Acanthopleuribacter pedis]
MAVNGVDFPFRVFAHINLKGGVGKTTSVVTCAVRAAQYGFRCVVLDLDSQASASLAFDALPEDDTPIFYDVWQKPAEMLGPALKRIDSHLYLLPSSLENGLLDSSLANPRHQKKAVAEVCAELKRLGFDVVFIDCPPSLGTAVISSICAADDVVIPIGSDPFSHKGLALTLEEIEAICDTYSLPIPTRRVLFARYDKREKLAAETLARMEGAYAEFAIPVPVRVSTEFSKVLARGETLFHSQRKNPARQDYDRIVRYLFQLDAPFA